MEPGKTYPVVRFLHGAGERGTDNRAQLKHGVTALKQAGGSPKATYYPKVQHDSWTRTYANPEVLKWLFAQRAK